MSGEAGGFDAGAVSGKSLAGLAYLVVMGTAVTFSAYIWLLRHVSPTRVATYAFVNPAVAVALGWAVAGESLSPGTLLATAVIIGAVAVAVSDRPRPQLDAIGGVGLAVAVLGQQLIHGLPARSGGSPGLLRSASPCPSTATWRVAPSS